MLGHCLLFIVELLCSLLSSPKVNASNLDKIFDCRKSDQLKILIISAIFSFIAVDLGNTSYNLPSQLTILVDKISLPDGQ